MLKSEDNCVEKLLPCPFCGGEAEDLARYDGRLAKCSNHNCELSEYHYWVQDSTWNTRAASHASHIEGLDAKVDELRDALLDMVWQFCSRNNKLAHSFMSAEEHAFDVLDLDNGMTYEEAEAASKQATLPPELRGE